MDFKFIWEAVIILFFGFCLLRITGKKTIGEMTGLEIITLLAMASVIGHAVAEDGLWETAITLSVFVALLLAVQYLSIKFDWVERWFMGKATVVIQNGKIVEANLKKLRLSVDQLEAKLRENGISSFRDLKTATIEISGQLGYEWAKHAQPVTLGDLEKLFASLHSVQPPKQQKQEENLFNEVMQHKHQHRIPPELE
ncbi:DUF421 domain-containing protein [Cohnella nanjingensis]|uniref:DUF421 domain-containing protein n=1 Tax=Cohnella nanjingensis TaxID=1387779 RepID=A0A7X0RNP5_9BACL|nr:YetF domain-containing protein [Cohnella nanjingensis]MBB6670847.1 DUF421 domain-containing protein [Cohnella nanjingensis]